MDAPAQAPNLENKTKNNGKLQTFFLIAVSVQWFATDDNVAG